MWRTAHTVDDAEIVAMCLALNAEDPGQLVTPAQIMHTLTVLQEQPLRGRAAICEAEGHAVGYALLMAFWSNEYGGEMCVIDELFMREPFRNRGHGTALIEAIELDRELWPRVPAALLLEVNPSNRARRLYERLGFQRRNETLVRSPSRRVDAS